MLNTEYMYSLGAPQRLYSLVFVFTRGPLAHRDVEYSRGSEFRMNMKFFPRLRPSGGPAVQRWTPPAILSGLF